MRPAALLVAFIAAAAGASSPVAAASLRVAPVLIDAADGQRAGVLTLTNPDTRPISVQVRVFRWTQTSAGEKLEPTRDVVASPPATMLAPASQHVARVVRTAAAAPTGEESYRVFVDEVPDASSVQRGVSFVLRQSIPVFFAPDHARHPDVSWRLVHDAAGWALVARNAGGRRLRISDLELQSSAGAVLEKRPGLVGYVLSGAEVRWPLRNAIAPTGAITLTAATDAGPLHVDLGAPPR